MAEPLKPGRALCGHHHLNGSGTLTQGGFDQAYIVQAVMADNFFQAFDVVRHRLKGNNIRILMCPGQMYRHYADVGPDIENEAAVGHHIPEIDKIPFLSVPF